jgi:hypothetical protein
MVTRKAWVTGKRKTTGVSTAKCTFEFEDGTREEFDVSLDTYVSLTPNDFGYLKTKGSVFWGFQREGEGIRAASSSSISALIPEEPLARIKEALFRGQKIEAIRLYRECTGAGLIEGSDGTPGIRLAGRRTGQFRRRQVKVNRAGRLRWMTARTHKGREAFLCFWHGSAHSCLVWA